MSASTASVDDMIATMINAGVHPEDIMAKMGITPEALLKFAQENSIPLPGVGILPRNGPATEDEVKAAAQRAKEYADRERKLPSEQPPSTSAESLIESAYNFRARYADATKNQATGGQTINETYLGMPITFSETNIEKLKPISLSKMLVRKVHRGHYLLVRAITHAYHVDHEDGVAFGVEDAAGTATLLDIHNYPTWSSATTEALDSIINPGTIFAIREPSYKMYSDGERRAQIRVDSPSDIIFVGKGSPLLRGVRWSTPSPGAGLFGACSSADRWKLRGNDHFKAGLWLPAAVYFSNGLAADPKLHVLRLNRAEAYLRLGWFESAYRDADFFINKSGVQDPVLLKKAKIRAIKALYGQRSYKRVMDTCGASEPEDDDITEWREKAQQRLREAEQGDYDWCGLIRDMLGGTKRFDVADFVGPVEVKSLVGSGQRGLFASRDVETGELLVVSKAMIAVFHSELPTNSSSSTWNFFTDSIAKASEVVAVKDLIHKIWDDSDALAQCEGFYAGPTYSIPPSFPAPKATRPPRDHPLQYTGNIDVSRLEAIVTHNNHFPLNNLIVYPMDEEKDSPLLPQNDARLFPLPSLCNHSCAASAYWFTIGDVMVLRAARKLKAGEEVTVWYVGAENSFAYRSKLEKKTGFRCECILCEADRADGVAAREIRSKTVTSMMYAFKDCTTPERIKNHAIVELKKSLATIEGTYQPRSTPLKPDLAQAHRNLSLAYFYLKQENKYSKLRIHEEMAALEANGVNIVDRSVSGRTTSSFPVGKDAGPAHDVDMCIRSAHSISDAFSRLGDEVRSKSWLIVAIWLSDMYTGGEKEVFLLRFGKVMKLPDLDEIDYPPRFETL